ncbi:MBL fold metallo-hydrolase [Schaalia odontolytica]|uniref:MBL fold metallo-hydrolase n=1 Tax=Schaalia odontolytica TaxID=1660 RepID=UPI0028D2674F|nr:MBL fold metallo-hydrolase [Schaalia odontolytica]
MFTIEQMTVGAWKAECYALTNEAGTIVLDPGAEPQRILRWLGDKKVVGIILTHCHSDHIGAVNELVEAYGCWVACGARDVDGVADVHRSGFDEEGIDYTVDHVDRALEEGDVVTWGGDSLTVLNTPGHTPGSICLLCEDHKVMFSGDMLFQGAIGSTAFVLGNDADMVRSCARLTELDPALRVYPGHGGPTTMRAELPMLAFIVQRAMRAAPHNPSWREGSWW